MPTLAVARPAAVQALSADLPRLPPAVVARPRLIEQLLDSRARVRLLCAPAGAGKSVLLGQCVRQAPAGIARLWLNLDGKDLSPEQFYQRLAAALQSVAQVPAQESGLTTLLNRHPGRLWIFLDDYPRQADDSLDASLDQLIASTPGVCWWVASRRRPAWNLPRLLLQGELLEFGGEELALDRTELDEVLGALRLDLSDELRQSLLIYSEGWPAGLRLLLHDADEEVLRQRLQEGCAMLRDYVQSEVLASMEAEQRFALYNLALLPRFSRALCDYLFDGRGGRLLDELRWRQLFVRRLNSSDTWFRLWRPLADVLRQLPDAPAAAPVHVRACQWFVQHGDIREAVEQALLAGQVEVAVSYLQRFSQEQLLQGHSVAQLLQWREELPGWLFASSPG